jgi:primase-polymerase (primpol)-like protein
MSTSAVTTATAKPAAMAVIGDNIPSDLRACPQWVVWKWNWNGKKWDKPPLSAASGRKCSKTDAKNWCTFDAALAAHCAGRFDGVGFCFTENDPFAGVDLDSCRDPESGVIDQSVLWILETLNGYTEISPSGCGLKIFVRGKLLLGNHADKGRGIEMYDRGAYFTVTGHVVKW